MNRITEHWGVSIAATVLSGCAALGSVTVQVPSSTLNAFGYCMAAKGGTCSSSAQSNPAGLFAPGQGSANDSVSFASAGMPGTWSVRPFQGGNKAAFQAVGVA